MQLFLGLLTVEKLIRSNVLQFEINAATRVAKSIQYWNPWRFIRTITVMRWTMTQEAKK